MNIQDETWPRHDQVAFRLGLHRITIGLYHNDEISVMVEGDGYSKEFDSREEFEAFSVFDGEAYVKLSALVDHFEERLREELDNTDPDEEHRLGALELGVGRYGPYATR